VEEKVAWLWVVVATLVYWWLGKVVFLSELSAGVYMLGVFLSVCDLV
jgi:hypothetical protein